MTHIEQAIKDALEAGWDDTNYAFVAEKIQDWLVGDWQYDEKIFLDPLWWQALGKAKGWHTNSFGEPPWKFHWHRFIDHLASGGDAESLFKDL